MPGTSLEQVGARYVRKRWVEDGKFISSAGVIAGIDTTLHLAAPMIAAGPKRMISQNR